MGGGPLIIKNHSLPQLLSVVYPDFEWETSKFYHTNDIWEDEYLANYFVEWLKKQSEKEVLYVYSVIKDMGKKNVTLTQKLKTAFPKFSWLPSATQSTKKSQYMLKQHLEKIFPGVDTILLEEYKHPDIISNNYSLELDYYFPQFQLALEYQVMQIVSVKKLIF